MAFQQLNGDYKQDRNQLFTWVDTDRTRGTIFKLKEGGFRLDVSGKIFSERVVKRTGTGCPERLCVPCSSLPGGFQGQAGWGPGQPDLVLDIAVDSIVCGGGLGN